MKKYAVIVAGGEGNRAGGVIPKQFQLICGIPMLWWSVRAFYLEDSETEIIIVMHPGFFDEWDLIYNNLPEEDKIISPKIVCGGRTRAESVKNGLMSVEYTEDSYVAVHDAARPLVTVNLIRRGWEKALESRAAIPAIPETDTLRKLDGVGSVMVPRKDYVRVQTPQMFKSCLLKEAYSKVPLDDKTDDASVIEAFGENVDLFEGDSTNIKVTNPEDFKIAEVLMQTRSSFS